MKNRLPKRLSAWLLTLIMLMGMLPAMASADEVDEDLSLPAPQEDYGYVRLVFSEGEQIDLYHGEYITECSPTAAVHDGADEDFLTDDDYLALYYEGKLYCKAALDGVSIDADAVLPAENFALVPMGELAAQTPALGTEPVALTVEGSTEDPESGQPESGQPESGQLEGKETTEEEQLQQETLPSPALAMAPLRATSSGGYVDLQLRNNAGTTSKKLYDRQFIKVGTHDATVLTDNSSLAVLKSKEYVAYYINGTLYLNGDMSRMLIDITNAQQRSDGTVLIQVENNVTLSEDNCFIRTGNGRKLWIDISTGKTLTLNADNRYWQTSSAIYAGNNDDVLITGGGELRINCKGNATSEKNLTMRGIEARNVTISNATGVYINMTNDTDNTKSDKLCGIIADKLTVQDGGYLKIEVTGRKLAKGESRENIAIKANRLVLRDSASVDIISHKNVISDVVLTGTGEVLKMDIEGGRFHITNEGNINRYDDADNHRLNDHPFFNIYVENADSGATVNLTGVGDEGFLIESYSLVVGNWASEWKPTNEPNWNWAIGKNPRTAFTPTLFSGVYQGNRRLGGEITNGTHRTYTWGSMEYVSPDNGVWTVKYVDGQTYPDTAQNYDTTLNDTYVVAKGSDGKCLLPGSANITAPNDEKSTFMYWYDALHPEDGTWPARTWDYEITKDRLLVPVYGLMENEPALSELKTYNQYSYKELTFTTKDSFASACYIVKGLPKQGVGIETVADLKSGTKLFNSGQKLFADKNASHSSGSSARIPEGTYRLAYYTNGRWYFSEEFELKLPLAKPVVKPGSEVLQSPGKVPVQILAERGDVSYRYWDYSTNNWSTNWNSYTGTFDADVTTERDTRIQIKLRQENTVWGTPWETITEVCYGVCPSINPTVNYKDTALTNHSDYHYYGSIELTVDVPDGLELYYSTDGSPYVDYNGVLHGTKAENGKVIINGGQEPERYSFRFCKTFTADGQTYRGIYGAYTTFLFTKLDTLPVPNVTFYDGETKVTPGENNTVIFHEKLTATLSKPHSWPINAEMHYSRGGVSDYLYKKAVEYTESDDLRVYAVADLADGGTQKGNHVDYTIKQDPSHVTKTLSVRANSGIKVYDINNVLLTPSISGAINNQYTLNVGRQITVQAPTKSGTKVFRYWTVSNGQSVDFDNKNSPRATFIMPDKDIQLAAYYDTPTNISEQTRIKFTPGNPAGMNMALQTNYDAWRSLSYQWYEGDTASGTPLNSFDSFETGKTYTAHVKVTATEGIIFTDAATIKVQRLGSNLEVANEHVDWAADHSSLAFDLHLLTKPELTIAPAPGDTLPTAEALTDQLPEGYTVKTLTWADNATTDPGSATTMIISKLEIEPVDGSYQLANDSVWINGTEHAGTYRSGKLTLENISLSVKPKGAAVSGTVKSYGSAGEAVTVTLLQGTSVIGSPQVLTKVSSAAPYIQNYSFSTVPAGTYTLKVMKKGHAPWTEEITVGSAAVTKDVTIYLIGDVNKDGVINGQDLQRLYEHLKGENPLPTGEVSLGNVNGDSNVNGQDLQRLYEHLKGENPLT